MNLVRLTQPDGKAVWINPDQVCAVSFPIGLVAIKDAQAHVQLTSGSTYVIETPAYVIALLGGEHDQAP